MHKNTLVSSKIRVLVVDDDRTLREMLCGYLFKNGFDTIEAGDYDQAIELHRLTHPDLVLTDVALPGRSGIDLLYELKKGSGQPMVILMTGYGNEEILLEALRGGAANYFTKPFDHGELLSFIQSAFRQRVEPRFEHLVTGALVYEKKQYAFHTKDADIPSIVSHMAQNLRLIARDSELMNLQLGIQEMIDNAIEHGHLHISYEEKSAAIESGTFGELLRSRIKERSNADKTIRVDYELSRSGCTIEIEDEGDGFDWRALPDPSQESLYSFNGRGIFLTRIYYDSVTYNDKGNRVTLRKKATK